MLQISHLTKNFGKLCAVNDLSFQVSPGEIMGFVGSNGAGKSTTMRIILGVLEADSGTVTWQGKPLNFHVRQSIGYMPEERGLYPKMQVGEHLVYLAQLHGMSSVQARHSMEHWTEVLGLAPRRRDEISKLSLGNQQRVQLAAALVHNPQILVLDEPFSGLDPIAVEVMSEVLRERASHSVATLFSSHQLDLVERISDRITIISGGKLVSSGTVTQLRDNASVRFFVRPADANQVVPIRGSLQKVKGVVNVKRQSDQEGVGLLITFKEGLKPNPARLLQVIQSAGTVSEFSRYRPSLSEVYAGVVTSKEPAPTAPSRRRLRAGRRSR